MCGKSPSNRSAFSYLLLLWTIYIFLSDVEAKRGAFESSNPKCPWKTPVSTLKKELQGRKELIFDPIGNLSKFLVPHDLTFRTTPKAAAQICRDAGLDPAQIDTIEGYQSVVNFYLTDPQIDKEKGAVFYVRTLNKTDLAFQEEMKYTKATKDLKFQAYELGKSKNSYLEAGKECTALECRVNKCAYRNLACCDSEETPPIPADLKVIPLCQFDHKTAECYGVNMFSWLLHGDNQKLIPLGRTSQREVYGSNVQRWFDRAVDVCKEKGMKLLSFKMDNPAETAELLDLLKCYAEKLKLPKFLAPSWTSGRFPKAFKKGDPFEFVSSGTKWDYDENKGHFDWCPSEVKFPEVERCLVIAHYDGKLVLRPIACTMRNFFVCTQDSPGEKSNACHLEKAPSDDPSKQMGRGLGADVAVDLDYDSIVKEGGKPKPAKSDDYDSIVKEGGATPKPAKTDDYESIPKELPQKDADFDSGDADATTKPPRNTPPIKVVKGTKSSLVIDTPKVDRECQHVQYKKSPSSCYLHGCDFSQALEECTDYQKECPATKCVRQNTFMALNGDICYNIKHEPCTVAKSILAVNLNGSSHTASNGVAYQAGNDVPLHQEIPLIQTGPVPDKECPKVEGIRDQDQPLFEKTAHSFSKVLGEDDIKPDNCIGFHVPVEDDGLYEVSILVVEPVYKKPGKRLFNLKLNNITVAQNVDIVGLTGGRCHAADLVVHFEISNTRGTLVSSEVTENLNPEKGKIDVRFCLGECFEATSASFRIAAFSVTKLDPAKPKPSSAENNE